MLRKKLISTSDLVRAHAFMYVELSGHVLSPVKLEFLRTRIIKELSRGTYRMPAIGPMEE